ncbi:MAG: hypothetical protein EOO88_56340 [Pedobacter sp.]|nr:MAG: hypothetical protein EOO88_56340 [Pedobacter sp.]
MIRLIIVALCCCVVQQTMAQQPYPAVPPPPANIIRGEYFFDADPGYGAGQSFTIPAPATVLPNFNLTVNLTGAGAVNGFTYLTDVSGLTRGVHKVYVRSRDAAGKWSLTSFSQFDNTSVLPYPSAPAAPVAISQLEYFLDTDPGLGKGTRVSVTAGVDISNYSIDIPLAANDEFGSTLAFIGPSLGWDNHIDPPNRIA